MGKSAPQGHLARSKRSRRASVAIVVAIATGPVEKDRDWLELGTTGYQLDLDGKGGSSCLYIYIQNNVYILLYI